MSGLEYLATDKEVEDFVSKIFSMPCSDIYRVFGQKDCIEELCEESAIQAMEHILSSYVHVDKDHMTLTINILHVFESVTINYDEMLADKLKNNIADIDIRVRKTLTTLLEAISGYAKSECELFLQDGHQARFNYIVKLFEPLEKLFKTFKLAFQTYPLISAAASCLLGIIEGCCSILDKDDPNFAELLVDLAVVFDEILEDGDSYHKFLHVNYGERLRNLKDLFETFDPEDYDECYNIYELLNAKVK